jgi:hypothetical protein
MKPLKLYWSTSLKNNKKNFGDWLSPILCERLSGRRVVHAKPNKCDLIAVGSILQRVKHGRFRRKTHIWGSGFIEDCGKINSFHYFHAIRGYKSADMLKCRQHIRTYGDPGLLCDMLFPDHIIISKLYAVGVVPHYKDRQNPILQRFAEKNANIKIIDVLSETEDFIRQVTSCEFILSSSLHGLISADAFGIANAWIQLSDKIRGQNFKFYDYYSGFGINTPKPLFLNADTSLNNILQLANTYSRPNLMKIKQQLLNSFPFPKPREI